MSSKGCLVGQVTGDANKNIVFKVLLAKALILNLTLKTLENHLQVSNFIFVETEN